MQTLSHMTSLLVFTGALFMLAAIVLGQKTGIHIPDELRRRWRLMIALMYFFLAGYLVFAAILFGHLTIPTELVTGPVFLCGAFFVFIVINLARKAIGRTKAAEENLRSLNGLLEQRVADRTRDLQHSQDFLREVLDSLDERVTIIDVKDYTIVGANAAFLQETGRKAEEVIGKTCYAVANDRGAACRPPDDVCPLQETVESGKHAATEHVHQDGSGNRAYFEITTSPIRDKDGRIVQVVHVSQDITEWKQAQSSLQRYASDLAESNEELLSFMYSVSHDLRAPLVNIKGFSDELGRSLHEIGPCFVKHLPLLDEADRERIAPLLKKDIPEALNFIGSSVRRMDSLINALLKLSRAGRRKLATERINVSELVQTIVDSLAHQIETSRVRVATGELPDVIADRTALEQIFGNLLDNAVKYLEPGRNGEIEVSAEQDGESVVFHVRDNGRGMAQEDIPKAFEIFRRVGRQDVPGEGIGLAHVKTLVRLHGGRIWCDSEPGVGTTFSFSIPRQLARNEENHG